MRKDDGRKLDHGTLEELRKRAVAKIVEEGEDPQVIAKSLGLHYSTVYRWLRTFKKRGDQGLISKPLYGRPKKLNSRQLNTIRKIVVGKNPLQLKFSFALWTREMVQQLIKDKYGMSLALSSVGRMLYELLFGYIQL